MFKPEGFSEQIFKDRYAFVEGETWEQACKRLALQMASVESSDKHDKYLDKFQEVLTNNYFVPGGRIWYNSGRPHPQLLNCFVLENQLDSKEGWGNLSNEMIVTSMTGGGCGCDFSDVRPRGAKINGQKGDCPGPVELMKLINYNGGPVRAGGARRVALMFSLDLDHPSIMEFLDTKLTKGELSLANVSVRSKNTQAFIEAVNADKDWELVWKGQYKQKIKARTLWDIIVKNSYTSAEPGFLNWELALSESNIWYIEQLISTNPCFSKDTRIVTSEGLERIDSLVGKKVDIWNGEKWQTVDNFRVTGKNKQVLKITMKDGSELKVTPNHKMILEDGSRVEAQQLEVGQKLAIGNTETNGNIEEKGTYLKGFLVGDGTLGQNKPILKVYFTKYMCEDRLLKSAAQLKLTHSYNQRVKQDLNFIQDTHNRKNLQGLTARKEELIPWCSEYKKYLPEEIFKWDYSSKCEFIAGVLDADGTANDSSKGFSYQIVSIHKKWLLDFQMLLKTIGVHSTISFGTKGRKRNFNDGYGEYEVKDTHRITIPQKYSIKLAKQVNFSRLISFADKNIVYNLKPTFNKIKSIEIDTVEDVVYCCTVEGSHSLSVSNGLQTGNCGEIAMSSHDACCLGHLVLPRFVLENNEVDWHLIANTVRTGVRFLDNVLTVNNYPLQKMKEKVSRLRRIGLGATGLADMLALLGIKYGSEESFKFADKLFRFISKTAYEASVMLAIEKGPFPACNPELHVKSGYMKRMPKKIKDLVLEHGIRNCAILSIAPTGTTSILSGNCSSGIEPMFSPAYERRYWVKEERKTELVFHPLFSKFMKEGKSVEHFVGARDLSVKEHMEMQKIVQNHIDNAVSKTINIPENYPMEEVSALWLEYLPYLKGTTFYRENTRGYVDDNGKVHEPPLVAISLEEAKEKFKSTDKIVEDSEIDCVGGSCEI